MVLLVVHPAFRLVGAADWANYHAAHAMAITRVVALPWLVQGMSAAALLLAPPPGGLAAAGVLAALALTTVGATVAFAVPAHGRLAAAAADVDLVVLLRATLAWTLAWTGSTVVAAALL